MDKVVEHWWENGTLNDGQENDDDEEEEGDVKEDAVNFVVVTVGWFNFVTNTATGTDTLIRDM